MDKTMVEVERDAPGKACPACGAGRVDDVGERVCCMKFLSDA